MSNVDGRQWREFFELWTEFARVVLLALLLATFVAWPVFVVEDRNEPPLWAIVWMVIATLSVMVWATWPRKKS